jgi:hypothetical protein
VPLPLFAYEKDFCNSLTIIMDYVNNRLLKHISLFQCHIRWHVKELNCSEICKSSSYPENQISLYLVTQKDKYSLLSDLKFCRVFVIRNLFLISQSNFDDISMDYHENPNSKLAFCVEFAKVYIKCVT